MIGDCPGIEDANVYGIRLPNHDGRAGCAAIAVKPGGHPDFQALAHRLTATLPKYAVPLFVRITKSMQMTGNMKHQKVLMRDEGVDPVKIPGETILWLKDGQYTKFTKEDWEGLKAGQIKL